MGSTTIYLAENVVDEIDDRRHSTTSRSKWIREAILARLRDEDAGEWVEPPNAKAPADA